MSVCCDFFHVNIEQIHTLLLVSLLLSMIKFHFNIDSISVCMYWKKGTFLTNELTNVLLMAPFDGVSMFFHTPYQMIIRRKFQLLRRINSVKVVLTSNK